MRHPRAVLMSSVLSALALTACGSSSGGSSSGTSATSAPPSSSSAAVTSSAAAAPAPAAATAIAADPGGALKFSTTHLQAKAGTVRVSFTNQAPEGHNLTIAAGGGQIVGATSTFSGGKRSLTVHLKAGTYTFFCSVPGHRMAGMQGTLVVS